MKLPLNTTMSTNHLRACLNSPIQGQVQKLVNINITFGDPRRNCAGTGVCQILSPEQRTTRYCKGTTVKGYIRCFDDQSLQIIVSKNQMTLKEQQQYFANNIMSFCADMSLAYSLTRELNIKAPLHICAGKYSLFQHGQYYYFFVQFRTDH